MSLFCKQSSLKNFLFGIKEKLLMLLNCNFATRFILEISIHLEKMVRKYKFVSMLYPLEKIFSRVIFSPIFGFADFLLDTMHTSAY